MNIIERERPIRLTFAGEVESYDWQTAQWIRDLSRDPREFIPLSYPPSADAYLSTQKATCANAIVHQLKFFAEQQNSAAGDTTVNPIEPQWDNVFYAFYNFLTRISVDTYTGTPNFWDGLIYLAAKEWWLVTNLYTLMNSTLWDKVVCHVWCHMSEDCTFTYPNWLGLVQAISDDSTLGDAQQWLKIMVIMLGRKGLANLGFLKINDGDVSDPATDCTC